MSQTNENNYINNKNENIPAEILVLDLLSKSSTSYQYVVSYQKTLFEATIPIVSLKNFGRNGVQFGTILVGYISVDLSRKEIRVKAAKRIYMLNSATPDNKWAQLKLEFNENLKKQVIACSALTSGCFTYLEKEYATPGVFNNILGIIDDSEDTPQLPQRQIGRLFCTVTTGKCSIDGSWKLRIQAVKRFDKVLSLTMDAAVGDNEHYGLVTREECEEKRDLRLVSSRDFPRDVRIFRSGSHCCESIESGHRRVHHHHTTCINTCVGEMLLIGKCMAFRMKRCQGMNAVQPIQLDSSTTSSNSSTPSPPVTSIISAFNSEGSHVDFGSMRGNVSQLEVNVQCGFVEVVTIAEYSGYTDHDGRPLLWSHDVEFVVDISQMFHDQNLSFGLYKIKVVRFHRSNVFAKWRLARRNPILQAMQTRFHSQSAHSINLASMGLNAITQNGENTFETEQQEPRGRVQSFSRFGNSAQSCCLPRTDSLDKVELFDALVRNVSISMSTTSSETTPLAPKRLNGRSASVSNKVDEIDDDLIWLHHDTSVLKIVEDDDESAVLPENNNKDFDGGVNNAFDDLLVYYN